VAGNGVVRAARAALLIALRDPRHFLSGALMYQKPVVRSFGSFRALTQACCSGTSDGQPFQGSGPSVGDVPRVTDGTPDFCFHGSSR